MKAICFIIFSIVSRLLYGFPIDSVSVGKDSIYLSLDQVDSIFLIRNFQLLAQKYNISMADAAIIQARLFNNPILTYENVVYNGTTHRFFDYRDEGGEFMVQIQQIIRTAGKRSKLIALAEMNKDLQQFAFEDLIRVLRYQVYSDYAIIYSDLKKLQLQRLEEAKLTQLVEASKNQLEGGIISAYELIRIEYELQNLRTLIRDQLQELIDIEAELKLFLLLDQNTFLVPTGLSLPESLPVSFQSLLDSAYKNRPDFKLSKTQFKYMSEYLALQKALAIPDVMIGSVFDRYGAAFPNYFGVNITTALPLFNRNQGNIKISQWQKELANKTVSYTEQQVTQDVSAAYDSFVASSELFHRLTSSYEKSFFSIINEAIRSYQERVIGLLDFIDKIRTFENGQLNIIEVQLNYFLNTVHLNYVSNSKIY